MKEQFIITIIRKVVKDLPHELKSYFNGLKKRNNDALDALEVSITDKILSAKTFESYLYAQVMIKELITFPDLADSLFQIEKVFVKEFTVG